MNYDHILVRYGELTLKGLTVKVCQLLKGQCE